jgi:hypothetical protein
VIGQYIELAVIDLDIEIEYNIDSFIEIFDISLEGAKSSFGRLYRKGIGSTQSINQSINQFAFRDIS